MLKEFGVSNRNGYSFRPATKVLEAPSNEGAFLVSETPPSGKHRGWGTGDGGGVPIGSDGSPNLGPQELLLGCKELF